MKILKADDEKDENDALDDDNVRRSRVPTCRHDKSLIENVCSRRETDAT